MRFFVVHPTLNLVCVLSVLFFLNGCGAQAQEEAEVSTSEVSDVKAAADPVLVEAEEENPFPIPDGDVEELLAFMEKVQTADLPEDMRSREGAHKWLRFQVAAVLKVCEKIESQKPGEETQLLLIKQRIGAYKALSQIDETANDRLGELIDTLKEDTRPEVKQLVARHQLTSSARGFFQMSDEQKESLIRDLFSYMDEYGIDETSFSLASQLGEVLEQSDNPKIGAPIFDRLAKELKQIGDPRLQPQIAKYEGSARRLNLPGNFMEISGTTVDGEQFDWASYRGKVVLVDFWASWCGPCRAEIPNMKAQLEKYGDKGFAIVGISLDDTKAQYQAVVDQEELTWVNLMSQNEFERGWNHPLAVHYGVSGIPTAILVDQEGKVVSMTARGELLNILLEQMLGAPEGEETEAAK